MVLFFSTKSCGILSLYIRLWIFIITCLLLGQVVSHMLITQWVWSKECFGWDNFMLSFSCIFWEVRLMPWATEIGSLLTTFLNLPNFSLWHLYILLGRLPTPYLNTSFMFLISVMTFLHLSLAWIFISLSDKTPQF